MALPGREAAEVEGKQGVNSTPRHLAGLVALIFAVFVLKSPTLTDPYHWDALGYVASTAMDMVDHGFRLTHPYNTGHPPLFCLALAAAWTIFGCSPLVSHVFVVLIGAVGIYFTYRLGEFLYGRPVGVAAATLTLLNQIVFAQLGTLNVVTALFTLGLGATSAYLRGKWTVYVLTACLLVLTHQPAVLFVGAFALHRVLAAALGQTRRGLARDLALILAPVAPLALWSVYFAHATGGSFLNPGWLSNTDVFFPTLRVNAVRHFLYDGTPDNVNRYNWVLVTLLLPAETIRRGRPGRPGPRAGLLFALLIAVHLAAFSWSDDLPRYFMPVLPYFYIAGARALSLLLEKQTWGSRGVVLGAVLLGALSITNYGGHRSRPGWQLESNLEYRDHIQTHVAAARYIEQDHPQAVVVTCWPMSGELGEPRHGYVSRPIQVSVDYDDPPPGALLYDSPESDCRGRRPFRELVRNARLLRRFEHSGKSAAVYAMGQ
jgi:hypothetical protein